MRITLVLFVFILFLIAPAEAQQSIPHQPPAPDNLAALWLHCTAAEKIIIFLASGVVAVVGMIVGWRIFPLTIAPIAYLTKSELAIWGSRLSMAIGGGIAGCVIPFMVLVRLFGS